MKDLRTGINPNLGGLFRGSFTPFLKLVRIVLETSNLAPKDTHINSFKKYTFSYQGSINFVDVCFFFAKNQHFLAKIAPLLKATV